MTAPWLASAEPASTAQPYRRNLDHLRDELARVDQLVRAQTVRWRMGLATTKPAHLWGMIHVTDDEVNAFLEAPFSLPSGPTATSQFDHPVAPFLECSRRMGEAIADRLAATGAEVELRLERLTELFGLGSFESDLLLAALLPELDARYRRLYGYLQDDASRTRPTVELLLQILLPSCPDPGAARVALDRNAPLLAFELLVIEPRSEQLPMQSVHVDRRISGFLLGADSTDDRLAAALSIVDPLRALAGPGLDEDLVKRLESLAGWWRRRRSAQEPGPVCYLKGAYGSGKLFGAATVCAASDTPLLEVDVDGARSGTLSWDRFVRLAYREAALRKAALFWRGSEKLLSSDPPAQDWARLVDAAASYRGPTFLGSEVPWEPRGQLGARDLLWIGFPRPAFAQRCRLWRWSLENAACACSVADKAALAEVLANAFQLTGGQIRDAVVTARAQAAARCPGDPQVTVDDLYAGCRRQSGRLLASLAQRIEPRSELTFDDLVLPSTSVRQLQELRERIRNRSRVYAGLGFDKRLALGKGLIALFTGSSGTGKTMAAELLAREQGVALYKVDLSAVVSKYVGETEKNLSRVFDEAEGANAILFFDEADALFGKRGEVKEARDRWANIEVNYLLQRLEEYSGVVVMASNLSQNIDEAFLRRIHAVVAFPSPDVEARLRIWMGMFPPELGHPPPDRIRHLAEYFPLSGGNIKNIVLDATFRAFSNGSGGGTRVGLRDLVASTAREYQKLGRPISAGEFKGEFHDWVRKDIL